MRKLTLLAILVISALTAGCATRKHVVKTTPTGANFEFDGMTRTTPARVSVPMFQTYFTVRITKDGYEPVIHTVNGVTSGDGVIYWPSESHVRLVKKEE